MTLDGEQMHAQNSQVIDEFGRNGGYAGGNFEGAPVLLLHGVGAEGGAERINPMMYQQVGDVYAVFASAAGDDDHPAWYHNLLAHPDVTAEVGCTALALHARVLDDAERAAIWERYGDAGTHAAPPLPDGIMDRRDCRPPAAGHECDSDPAV